MKVVHICPRCKDKIKAERLQAPVIVCQTCAWVSGASNLIAQEATESSSARSLVFVGIFVVASFFHLVTWDSYSLKVIPYQVKYILKKATQEDIKAYAKICELRQKPDCVEDLYLEQLRINPHQVEAHAELGKIQFLQKKYPEAAKSFAEYFKKGGLEIESSYYFARTLHQLGQNAAAARYYSHFLNSQTDNFEAAHSYIQLLLESKKHKEALRVISKIRARGANASYFMEDEFQKLSSKKSPKTIQ